MSHLKLADAVLPKTINSHQVEYLLSLLDCPENEDSLMIRKIAAFDFIYRIFAADQDGKSRQMFLENGIYQKLNCIMKESINKNDKHSLLITTTSISLVYLLLSIPIKHELTIPLSFLEYFLTIISENKLDSCIQPAISCLCLLNWTDINISKFFFLSFLFLFCWYVWN